MNWNDGSFVIDTSQVKIVRCGLFIEKEVFVNWGDFATNVSQWDIDFGGNCEMLKIISVFEDFWCRL